METRTLIKDTATVARVTQLTEGDAYRRLIPKTAYSEPRMVVGVVTSVMNNGETIAITALEVDEANRYTSTSPVKQQIFEGDADLALFPVVDGEAQEILSLAQHEMTKRIESKTNELAEAKDQSERLNHVVRLIALGEQADRSLARDGRAADHFDYLDSGEDD